MIASESCKLIRMSLIFICALMLLSSTATAQEGMSREEVIDALRKGVVALKTIDRPEDARRMANILEDYLNPNRKKRTEREPSSKSEKQLSEREIGIQHVKHMRMALEGLIAAEKIDAAETLEKAIRARELRLEGKRDKKSQKMIADSPSRGAQIELLMYAAKFLKEQGKTEKAQVVQQLAEKFRRPKDSDRNRASTDLERQKAEADRKIERAEKLAIAKQREAERKMILQNIELREKVIMELKAQQKKIISQIEAQMEQVEKQNEELRKQLKSMERRDKKDNE